MILRSALILAVLSFTVSCIKGNVNVDPLDKMTVSRATVNNSGLLVFYGTKLSAYSTDYKIKSPDGDLIETEVDKTQSTITRLFLKPKSSNISLKMGVVYSLMFSSANAADTEVYKFTIDLSSITPGENGQVLTTENNEATWSNVTAGSADAITHSIIPECTDSTKKLSYNSVNDTFSCDTFSVSYNSLSDKPSLFSGAYGDLTGKPDLTLFLSKASNLSDIVDASAARSNLGLGSAATLNSGTSSGEIPVLALYLTCHHSFLGRMLT
jgi:hypothetical protein